MTRTRLQRALWASPTACIALLCAFRASIALARPGGGQTFGGGSHDNFGGHGDGDGAIAGELIWLLIRLVFFHPVIGVPLLVIGLLLWMRIRRSMPQSWESGTPRSAAPHMPSHSLARPIDRGLTQLREQDPDFSRVVLEDFAFRLYASVYRARHDPRALAGLAPYLSERVVHELTSDPQAHTAVSNVVVGSLKIDNIALRPASDTTPPCFEITLDYVSNVSYGPNAQTFYQHERWQLRRDISARTQPLEQTERLGCPNCAAPFESSDGRRCGHCGQVVADGRFAWQVVGRTLLSREARPPALTSDVPERGTNLPSVVDPENQSAWQALCARDPTQNDPALEARLALIYATLNEAWTALDLRTVRALVSDGMFDYLRYWTLAYRAEGLRNELERMHIQRVQRVKVVVDRQFDAVTLRLWASGLDYTVNANSGAVVSGSRSTERSYSEYWTLIRAAGAHGAPRSEATCPSCAAPLAVTEAGACQHCGSHVTRGEFDWVLSKIEQDDVYTG